jgi:hypothetical protein
MMAEPKTLQEHKIVEMATEHETGLAVANGLAAENATERSQAAPKNRLSTASGRTMVAGEIFRWES